MLYNFKDKMITWEKQSGDSLTMKAIIRSPASNQKRKFKKNELLKNHR